MKEPIKNIFDNFEPTPPPQVWDNVATALDAHKKSLIYARLKKAGIATTATLLVSATILYFAFSGKKSAEVPIETKEIITESKEVEKVVSSVLEEKTTTVAKSQSIFSPIKKMFSKGPEKPAVLAFLPEKKKKDSKTGLNNNSKPYDFSDIYVVAARGSLPNNLKVSEHTGYVSPLDDDFLKYYYFDKPGVVMPSQVKNQDEKVEANIKVGSNYENKEFKTKVTVEDIITKGYALERGFYFGAGIGVHFTSLSGGKSINNDFIKNNFTDKLLSHGNSLEFVAGYDINRKFGIVSEIKYTQISQRYMTPYFDQGLTKQENIKLNYVRAPILFKYRMIKLMRNSHKPISINYLFGPHMSHLVAVKKTVEGKSENFKHAYNEREVGFTAAIETDIFFTPKFFMTIGYRTEMGWGTTSSPLDGRIRSFNSGIYTRFNLRQPQTIKKASSYYR